MYIVFFTAVVAIRSPDAQEYFDKHMIPFELFFTSLGYNLNSAFLVVLVQLLLQQLKNIFV
jgi:hypothetical protein